MTPALSYASADLGNSRQRKAAAVRLLRDLDTQLTALDEALLLAMAGHVFSVVEEREEPRGKPRLSFHRVERLRSARKRLRFNPLPPEVDRMVIQNWNPHPGFVPVGDVELELGPGQAITLWVNRAQPTPRALEDEQDRTTSSLFILSDDEALNV